MQRRDSVLPRAFDIFDTPAVVARIERIGLGRAIIGDDRAGRDQIVDILPPKCDFTSLDPAVALLVRVKRTDADSVVKESIADDPGEFRVPVIALFVRRVVHGLGAKTGNQSGLVHGPRRHEIDRRTDATAGPVRAKRLVDVYGLNTLGWYVGEIPGTRRITGQLGGRHLAAVEQYQVELGAEATNRYLAALVVRTINRYARNALHRFGQVRIRELADIFRGNRVHHTFCGALRVHGRNQAAANAYRDDFLDDLLFLRNGRRQCGRPECQCDSRG